MSTSFDQKDDGNISVSSFVHDTFGKKNSWIFLFKNMGSHFERKMVIFQKKVIERILQSKLQKK